MLSKCQALCTNVSTSLLSFFFFFCHWSWSKDSALRNKKEGRHLSKDSGSFTSQTLLSPPPFLNLVWASSEEAQVNFEELSCDKKMTNLATKVTDYKWHREKKGNACDAHGIRKSVPNSVIWIFRCLDWEKSSPFGFTRVSVIMVSCNRIHIDCYYVPMLPWHFKIVGTHKIYNKML